MGKSEAGSEQVQLKRSVQRTFADVSNAEISKEEKKPYRIAVFARNHKGYLDEADAIKDPSQLITFQSKRRWRRVEEESDTPRKAGGLMSWTASKAVG